MVLVAALTAGCRQDMHDQPRYEPLEASSFFADGRASRPLVEGTVPRGHLHEDDFLYRGKEGAEWASRFPFVVTRETLDRGRERYEIFCTPCHGLLGDGKGMVVRRGFPQAASFHDDRLRDEKPGYFFDVITNGFGRMSGYASQLHAEDRWAVVAYIRALQLSQNVPSSQLAPVDLRHLAVQENH
jgi:mono/diheme cytochrome c family protein